MDDLILCIAHQNIIWGTDLAEYDDIARHHQTHKQTNKQMNKQIYVS